ncbi:serine/threonine-protein kinase [Streptomyces sp. NPDC048290]|uniref:serine/threonine-protein kinase n=1 Tax=Streptomyces sp. NPDC048290 TaxID=3155811 RepID=UPI003445C705
MSMAEAHVVAHELVAGRYRLLDAVQQETNRVSWYGEDVDAGRPCLLTRVGLPPGSGDGTARRATGRILRTAEAMGALAPGRVPGVIETFADGDSLWTATEWPGGTPLSGLLAEEGSFNYVRAARLGLELLDVLDAAHGEGITHGELSPGQVFVPDRGPLLVLGFGLAGATLAPRLTAPSYASPEQARDERVGPAADLWALGALLYTMVEGRPPFRDRDRPEATLRGVDRLPLRAPLRAGPLAQVITGLLRKNSRERLSRPVTRDALVRVLSADPEAVPPAGPRPRLSHAYASAVHAGSRWNRRWLVAGTALALAGVTVAVAAAVRQPSGDGGSAAAPEPPPRPSASAPPTTPPTPPPSQPPSPSPTPSRSGLPAGFRTFTSPLGFSVALPEGWTALATDKVSDLAYRVVLGAEGDPRTLTVTYSERVGPDPVAVWRDDVEPGLEQTDGYERIGEIEPTTYQGRKAADIDWLADVDGTRVRTFGRGVSAGGGIGYSVRWTTPAADWTDRANREALATVLRTFRPPVD